jgi:glycosyltransferase involved in cell wall biosynthesis
VSLIVTLKDEKEGIAGFLDSILSQSRLPDEVILVDGGSTDGTIEVIGRYQDGEIPFKLIVEKGCNISEGRNLAIREAGHKVIAVTDAGCILDKDWLKELVAPMESDPEVNVVAGNYKVEARGVWERLTSSYLMPYPERVSLLMPSGRSTCFRKKAWEDVGGYPEWLQHAEDSYFSRELRKHGHRFQFSPKAVVRWRPRPNPSSFFIQYYRYAIGDGMGRLSKWYYLRKIVAYSLGLLLVLIGSFFFLFLLSGLYLTMIMVRFWMRGKDRGLVIILPFIIVPHDIAQVIGYPVGLMRGGPDK